MSSELEKYEGGSFGELTRMADVFIESGLFSSVKSQAQAIVKIQAGKELGIEPFAAMQGIDIIQGKPVHNAGLQSSLIKGSGKYNYKVKHHDETKCTLEFYEKWDNSWEVMGLSEYTMETATKAGLASKDNWRKHPKNMLFARALSNGCKWFCADVFNGAVYGEADELHYEAKESIDNSGVEALKAGNLKKLVKAEPVEETIIEPEAPVSAPEKSSKPELTSLAQDAIDALRACAGLDELIELKDSIKTDWGLSAAEVKTVAIEFSRLQKEMK
jgi:hypothetical protein